MALELARAFDRGSAAVRVQLAEVFPETAQGATVTLPILLRHVGDAELAVRRACATAMSIILASDAEARAGIASKYVAPVARALASGDAEDRARVARAWVVSVDGDELTFLRPSLSALSGTDPAARTDAAWRILGAVLATSMSEAGAPRASTAPAELLPALTASLTVDGEHVGPAVQALGWLGSRSRDALPALDALLKRPGGARHSADVAAAKRRILGR